MCGRFTLTIEAAAIQQEFDLGKMPEQWIPRYNVAPTQPVVVVTDAKNRDVTFMHWGLIPSWAKDVSIASRLINARAETLVEKPSFRNAFKRRRCLILADGFYEWHRPKGKSGPAIPYYFYREEHKPFAFAGLWEIWQSSQGDELLSTTIVTCEPNEVVKPVHSRMPVILKDEDMWDWVKPAEQLVHQSMLQPYPSELLKSHPVSSAVNSPHNDTADCVLPVNNGMLF